MVDSENLLLKYNGVQRILFFEDPSAVNILKKHEFNSAANSILPSTGIAKKTSVSHKDKTFDNIDMLEKALRASNLLSLVDGSRRPPDVTEINSSGYTAEAIRPTIKAE